MFVSGIVLLVITGAGTGMTWWMSSRLRIEERIAIGAVVGSFAVAIVSFATFRLAGMGWVTLGVGLAVPLAAGTAGLATHMPSARRELRSAWRRLGLPFRHGASLRPLVAVTIASSAVSTRTLSLAYQATPRGVSVGSLAVWGDWSAHLAYAGSFAYGDNRVLDQPIASGTPFRYHFLSDFFGSLFTVSGSSLPQALTLATWLFAVVMPVLMWCVVRRISGSQWVAAGTVLVFTLSGGIGWWYWLADVQRSGWGALTALPQTYARMPDQHLWVDNTISASFYAQRSTQMGMAAGFAAILLILSARPRWSTRGFVAAGVLIGLTGITHAHVLFSALALGTLAWCVDRRREWAWFLGPATAIGLPLVWMIRPATSSLRWLLGWMAPAAHQPWPWFWFRNAGLLIVLFVAISLLGGAPRRIRRLTVPLWLWFVVPNLIAFHPSEWNNTKFFLFWQFAGALVVSWALVRWWSLAGKKSKLTALASRGAIAVCGLSLIAAGGLDAVRGMQRSSAIAWVDNDDLAVAKWLRSHTHPDAVVVYGANNTSAAAALGGRRSVSGYAGWTYDLGIPDWNERRTATTAILAGAPDADAAIRTYGVDYVIIGPAERAIEGASDEYWTQHGTLEFAAGEHRVYRTARRSTDEPAPGPRPGT